MWYKLITTKPIYVGILKQIQNNTDNKSTYKFNRDALYTVILSSISYANNL